MILKEFKTVSQIHRAFDEKKISVKEWIGLYLDASEKSDHGAYITLCKEDALRKAVQADELLAQSGSVAHTKQRLFGIPLGIKDVLLTKNLRTTCASKMLENYIPPYTSTAVERLELEGSIVLGKMNMDEFAMGSSNENSAFGSAIHPTHSDRVPGGSSGGSATGVKANLCFASLGTDTGGSIRLPASYCGIVGLKPSYGRISRYGQVAFASSLDQIGPLTHTVEDAALLMDIMSGYDPLDSTSARMPSSQTYKNLNQSIDWKKIKIGVPKEYFIGGLQEEVSTSIQQSIEWFKKKGAQLVSISLPHTHYSVAVYYIVAVGEASSNLSRFDGIRFGSRPEMNQSSHELENFYKKSRSLFGDEVKRRIILGTFALSSGYSDDYYLKACQVRRKIKMDFDEAFKKVDFILGPVAPTTAFKRGEKNKDPLQMYLNDIFTIPANLVGLPAISIPCGKDREDLPIGLHLIGAAFKESDLLSIAHHFYKESVEGVL